MAQNIPMSNTEVGAGTLKDHELTAIESAAIDIVRQERVNWEDATAFVNDRVAFNMRNLIRLLRKNYWGVFQEPIDPITGREKVWMHLTQVAVDNCVKNFDVDQKDINFIAKNPAAYGIARIVRQAVRHALDRCEFDGGKTFGEKLDMLENDMAIDGTKVWKTLEKMDKKAKKRTMQIKEPDLLNIYIDPTAPSIQEAYRFTERGLMFESEVEGMAKAGWINTKDVKGTYNLAKTDPSVNGQGSPSGRGSKYVDVWEMWGKGPNWLMTGKTQNEEEDNNEIDLHIVVSGLEGYGDARVHLIETYDGIKPYEEAWYKKVSNRWYGRGVGEMVMWLQVWLNTIVNIRINRSYVSQLGLFKIKKGQGITPQMISRLPANGALVVNNMDDIEQLVVQEASQASYKDEDNIFTWMQRITNAYEVVTGEQMPSSTPATNAALQAQGAKSGFTMIKEGLGFFLTRWLKRHALPIIMGNLTPDEIIRLEGDDADLRELDEFCINYMIAEQVKEANANGVVLDPQQLQAEKVRALERYRKMGKTRYVQLLQEIDVTEYDVEIMIDNEVIDKNVIAKDLTGILSAVPQYAPQILEQLFDIMGLNFNFDPQKLAPQQPQQGQPQGQPQPQAQQTNPSPQQIQQAAMNPVQ